MERVFSFSVCFSWQTAFLRYGCGVNAASGSLLWGHVSPVVGAQVTLEEKRRFIFGKKTLHVVQFYKSHVSR
jgi:hypothetical protein